MIPDEQDQIEETLKDLVATLGPHIVPTRTI